jgi:hypothetical protein
MSYEEVKTASDILEAFRKCKNPGEEIDLFEWLAIRTEPPIEPFQEILQTVKIEAVLVLTIRAFGLITNPELKTQLKQNDKLLAMLSERSKSGPSDLIRWSAATTIDKIGFGFLAISQHLAEEPFQIFYKILTSKQKILIDLDDPSKGELKTIEKSIAKESIDFWVYGPTYDLRSISAKYHGDNYQTIVTAVIKKQDIYGIKEHNKLLKKAEERDYPDRLTKETYENQVFEQFIQRLSVKFIKNKDPELFNLAIITQGHSLQSNDPATRLRAATILLAIDEKQLTGLAFAPKLLALSQAISACDFDSEPEFSYPEMTYEDLGKILGNLKVARELVTRDRISEYLIACTNKVSKDLALLSPEKNLKQILNETAQSELEDKIKQGKLARAEKQRLAKKEDEAWNNTNSLEIERDKIHTIKAILSAALPAIDALDNSLYLELRGISIQSIPIDDNSLIGYRQSIIAKIKSSPGKYQANNKLKLAELASINLDLQSKISKLEKEESTIKIGYGFMALGGVFILVPNLGTIFIGAIFIGVFIFIQRMEIDRIAMVKKLTQNIADNTAKAKKITDNLEVIDELLRSISK